jgi:hypothetical protein
VGNKCAANYTSCSGGQCSMEPAIRLTHPSIVWQGAVNGSASYKQFNVTLPFKISLYNTTTNHVSVTINGVSLSLWTHILLIIFFRIEYLSWQMFPYGIYPQPTRRYV